MNLFLQKLTKPDIFLILFLLSAAVTGHFILLASPSEGTMVVITLNNEEYGRYMLSEDKEIQLPVKHGPFIIWIKNLSVFVEDSHCPAGTCKRMGKKSGSGDMIVCIPNKVIIQVKGGSTNMEAIAR